MKTATKYLIDKDRRIKILATLGPSSYNKKTIRRLDELGVDIFRINLSHTPTDEISSKINFIKEITSKPICLDTEGAQIRTSSFKDGSINLKTGVILKIHSKYIIGDEYNIMLTPPSIIKQFVVGDLIYIDFHRVLLKVITNTNKNKYVEAEVISGGKVGNHKGVSVDRYIPLPPLSEKDLLGIEITNNENLEYIALSFASKSEDVRYLKRLLNSSVRIISKVENRQALINLDQIIFETDEVLIDRGDLSREVPLEEIPLIQKMIINKCNDMGTPVYIATNLLESMVNSDVPTRAEINDIMNTLIDGADGLVLAAECAIGDNPESCVFMMNRVINSYKNSLVPNLNKQLLNKPISNLGLIRPHGNKLIRTKKINSTEYDSELIIKDEFMIDAQLISNGGYSPLDGFMNQDQFHSVLSNNTLIDGTPWTMPIILQVSQKEAKNIKLGDNIKLLDSTGKIASIYVEEIYSINKSKYSILWYGTYDSAHPGVHKFIEYGDIILGGKIDAPENHSNNQHILTPNKTRQIFLQKQWYNIAGFHTRNIPHRGHEYIQCETLKMDNIDGLFIHPVIGPKKTNDFDSNLLLYIYEIIINKYYDKNRVLLAALPYYPRYAGPRETIFTAIVRKNYGCTHFIIGRDHAGVGDYYKSKSVNSFDIVGDIGIELIQFDEVVFSANSKKHTTKLHPNKNDYKISATEIRNLLIKGKLPPDWLIREEIGNIILRKLAQNESVFI